MRRVERSTTGRYLLEWADLLAHPAYHLSIGYTAEGPTLDVYIGPVDRVIRWSLETEPRR